MRLKCLPSLMNSLLASAKLKNSSQKNLLVDYQPIVSRQMTNSWPPTDELLFESRWTVRRQSTDRRLADFLGSCSSILPIFHPFPSILAGFPLTSLHRICEEKESFNTVHTCCNDELLVLYNHYTHDISAEHLLICHHPIKQCIEKCFLNQK